MGSQELSAILSVTGSHQSRSGVGSELPSVEDSIPYSEV